MTTKLQNAVVVMVGILTMGVSESAAAGPAGDYAKAAAIKLGHGLASMAYAPVDVLVTPCAFAIDRDRKGAVAASAGFSLGIPLGMLNALYRYSIGGAEVTTFLFVGDPGAERRFDVTPGLTGWEMIPRPPRETPVQVARREPAPRPSGDGTGR